MHQWMSDQIQAWADTFGDCRQVEAIREKTKSNASLINSNNTADYWQNYLNFFPPRIALSEWYTFKSPVPVILYSAVGGSLYLEQHHITLSFNKYNIAN